MVKNNHKACNGAKLQSEAKK